MNDDKSDGTETEGLLPYDVWVEESLRHVIRRTLEHVSREGLPGDHHCYITFRTNHPGVQLPGHLRAQHPDTMTIVLQYQFENLAISDDGFSVTLRFGGKPEMLRIPFEAVTAFHDPAVNFGLQLNVRDLMEEANDETGDGAGGHHGTRAAAGEAADDAAPAGTEEETTGEVITLDQFRKK